MPLITCKPFINVIPIDPGYGNVSLLLQFNEAAGSTTASDSSSLHNSVTPSGQFRTVSTPAKFGNSGYFNGSSFLDVGVNPGRLGRNDFTIEAWINPTTQTSNFPTIFANYQSWFGGNGGISIFVGHVSANRNKYQVALNGSFPAIQSTVDIVFNQWTHVAVVRYNNRITLYINGISQGYFDVQPGQAFDGVGDKSYVGLSADEGSGFFNGYMDDFRVSKALARYTGNFTPPEKPFAST